jgi:CRISPR-associated endoribonuclease Cas6
MNQRTSRKTIKADTPQRAKSVAFPCQFQLTEPIKKLMKIAYDGGVGSKNSLGFGMVRELRKN